MREVVRSIRVVVSRLDVPLPIPLRDTFQREQVLVVLTDPVADVATERPRILRQMKVALADPLVELIEELRPIRVDHLHPPVAEVAGLMPVV